MVSLEIHYAQDSCKSCFFQEAGKPGGQLHYLSLLLPQPLKEPLLLLEYLIAQHQVQGQVQVRLKGTQEHDLRFVPFEEGHPKTFHHLLQAVTILPRLVD